MRINELGLDQVEITFGEIKNLAPYRIVDLLELRLLFGADDEFSKADFEDLLRDSSVFDKRSLYRLDWLKSDPRREYFESIEDLYIHCVWRHIEFRKYNFEGKTPFNFDEEILTLDGANLQDYQNYILLLLCSKLRLIDLKSQQVYLAAEFERLCKLVMANFFSDSSETFCFGPGSEDRQRFGNKLREGLISLGKYLGEEVRQNVAHLSDSGDYGLDIITLLNKDSFDSGTMFFLGQCAAMELEDSWKKKKKQATDVLDVIDACAPPLIGLFIPVAFRREDGKWFNPARIRQVSVFDRVRMLGMLN